MRVGELCSLTHWEIDKPERPCKCNVDTVLSLKKQLKPTSHNSWISWPACCCWWWIGLLVNKKSPGGTYCLESLRPCSKGAQPNPAFDGDAWLLGEAWQWLVVIGREQKKTAEGSKGRPGNGVKLFVGTARLICGSLRIVWEREVTFVYPFGSNYDIKWWYFTR